MIDDGRIRSRHDDYQTYEQEEHERDSRIAVWQYFGKKAHDLESHGLVWVGEGLNSEALKDFEAEYGVPVEDAGVDEFSAFYQEWLLENGKGE